MHDIALTTAPKSNNSTIMWDSSGAGPFSSNNYLVRVSTIMRLSRYGVMVGMLGLFSCTWVEPTREGSEVTLVEALDVETCSRVGTATASVRHKVGVYTRSQDKVTEELITLGKNQAAEMGGDSIVAKGDPDEGSMSFDVYKCGYLGTE
jgi:hypothetical protein